MICYKCHKEMCPCMDSAWIKHRDGARRRRTEWVCAECRVYTYLDVTDYSECIDLEEEE